MLLWKLGLLSLILAISPAPERGPDPVTSSTRSPAASWRLSLVTAGGFTGGGSGVEIWSDGSVFSMSTAVGGSEAEREYMGQKSCDAVRNLAKLLAEAEDVSYQKRGNMTTAMAWWGDDFRHEWSWPSFEKDVPQVLSAVKESLAAPEGLASGTPPSFKLGGHHVEKGAIHVLVAQDQTFTISLRAGDFRFEGEGRAEVHRLSEVSGITVPSEADEGSITVTEVDGGWITGEVKLNGETGQFRLPGWITVTP